MQYVMAFENIRTLRGQKILLRPLELSMMQDLFEAIEESSEELYRFLPWDCKRLGAAVQMIEKALEAAKNGAGLSLAIFPRNAPQRLAGVVDLSRLDPYTPRGDVSFWVRTSMTRQGVATDALSTALGFYESEVGLARVDAATSTENYQAQRILQKCGFQQEGLKRKGQLCHGVWNDLHLFGKILR